MNREIKFRAFQDGQMLTSPISSNYGLTRFFGLLYEDAPIMQFTGLKDKNGTEICEGDIIKYTQHHFNTDMTKEKVKVVKWMYDKWGIYETNAGESDIEIIGNIYENPELLLDRS